jgi:DNA-binding PadR family transcriptional regulator
MGTAPESERPRPGLDRIVLALLAEGPMHGYGLIREVDTRTEGAWRPSPGSMYPALRRLERTGKIESRRVHRRSVFSLTPAGEREAGASVRPWDDLRPPPDAASRGLWGALSRLTGSVEGLHAAGTTAQKNQGTEVLNDARRRLYRILAEGQARAEGQAGAEGQARAGG